MIRLFVCFGVFGWLTRPIIALNCRSQVEQVNINEIGVDPFTLSLCSLSASQTLFLHDGLLPYGLHKDVNDN